MAYHPITSAGEFGTRVPTTAITAVSGSDILLFNQSTSTVVFGLTVGTNDVIPVTLNGGEGRIVENSGTGAVTLASGATTHKTNAAEGARVHLFLSGTVDSPDLPTDNV